ncbi:hypothetical protein ABE545_09480 [Sphingobacterium faecium]|uniref:hypothetical protein n=1 Tax=Sphingobacterium faecium TaxID=34087 RepID=UPI00320B4AFE
MKKISLKSLKLEGVGKLSREQLKNVLGGSDTGSGTGQKYMCCPESIGQGVGCSSCVSVPPGHTASCSIGVLTSC